MPAISGKLSGGEASAGSSLLLRVMQQENPTLHEDQRASPAADGSFQFKAVEFELFGHEDSPYYRAYLHLQHGKQDRVLWRADLDRRALAGPVELDCRLDRPIPHGQPCWVEDPTRQPGLIEEGKQTFRRLCSSCHGVDARGGSSSSGSVGAWPPDLGRIAARREGRFDHEKNAEWIEGSASPDAHGPRSMPVWGERLSQEFARYSDRDELIGARLDPIIVYLESIQEID